MSAPITVTVHAVNGTESVLRHVIGYTHTARDSRLVVTYADGTCDTFTAVRRVAPGTHDPVQPPAAPTYDTLWADHSNPGALLAATYLYTDKEGQDVLTATVEAIRTWRRDHAIIARIATVTVLDTTGQVVATYERDTDRPGRYVVASCDLERTRVTVPAAPPVPLQHLPFWCAMCGMEASTRDLSVIGRNCPAEDFDRPHIMVRSGPEPRPELAADDDTTPTPGDDWRDDAERFGSAAHVFVTIEQPVPDAATIADAIDSLDHTDFSLTGEQARVAFTALAEHADGTRVPPLSGAARSYLSDLFDIDGGENCTDDVHAEVRAWLTAQHSTPAPSQDQSGDDDSDRELVVVTDATRARILSAATDAARAAHEDSNDDELNALDRALSLALDALGMSMPEVAVPVED